LILGDRGDSIRKLAETLASQQPSVEAQWKDVARALTADRTPWLLDSQTRRQLVTFEREMADLRATLQKQTDALSAEKATAKETTGRLKELESTLQELRQKERLAFVLTRVNSDGQRALLESEQFRKEFLDRHECIAFVMSIDIRRSTELMLKARSPEEFAAFITGLTTSLMETVTKNYGVFDKFTGDGILAFFPEFFTGPDAAYAAIKTASEAHSTFDRHYRASRRSFTSVLTDIGLGIGIDFGAVHLVQMAGGLTVVGAPVVYACRLSSAPPNTTLLNQPAYEVISERFSGMCYLNETRVEIKHEGRMLAYEVQLNGKEYHPASPPWSANASTERAGSNPSSNGKSPDSRARNTDSASAQSSNE
jgi:class 3 adenylate cyclase